MRPSSVGDPDENQDDRELADVFSGAIDHDSLCRPGDSWAPVENGTFGARLGKPIPANDTIVYREGSDRIFDVDLVFRVTTSSRCEDGLAIIALARSLDVASATIRFDDAIELDEPVTISGYCGQNGVAVRREYDTAIESATFNAGSDVLPPRAISMRQSASSFALGGPVFSSETGAVIGIVASASSEFECDLQPVEGTTIAYRLAPFSKMLLEVAAASGSVLRVEPHGGSQQASSEACQPLGISSANTAASWDEQSGLESP
jgi:hypothetical protein